MGSASESALASQPQRSAPASQPQRVSPSESAPESELERSWLVQRLELELELELVDAVFRCRTHTAQHSTTQHNTTLQKIQHRARLRCRPANEMNKNLTRTWTRTRRTWTRTRTLSNLQKRWERATMWKRTKE